MASFEFKIFLYLIIVFSASFHEYMHAWAAFSLGDPTAKNEGRLTLNPLKHIDPLWTVLLPLLGLFFFGFFLGAAKPVPYNPYNLRDQKYGSIKVGLAGPAANIFLAVFLGLIMRFVDLQGFAQIAISWVIYLNIYLAFFNLLPIPPLDGSHLLESFFPRTRILQSTQFWFLGIFLAVGLAFLVLPYIANFFYVLVTGGQFLGLAF